MGEVDDADVIAMAQGIVMSARGIGPEDAGLVLLVRADEQGASLAATAADVVRERHDSQYR